MKQIIEEG